MKEQPDSLAVRAAHFFRKHQLAAPQEHVLAAVSGGPDSTALLDLLLTLQQELELAEISVVHFDHRLRGRESEADADFVRALAESRGVALLCGSGDVRAYAAEHKVSIEMAARTCRHAFFREALTQLGADKLALGHTADDRAEEVLLRLFRGTGPLGLRAMLPATTEQIIRPLLFATRGEILSHLRRRGLSWREDPSNREPFCQRNALRNEILPLIRRHFHEGLTATVSRYADLAGDEESYWEAIIEEARRSVCLEETADRCDIAVDRLIEHHPALIRRVLRRTIEIVKGSLYGVHAVHIESVFRLVREKRSGKRTTIPGGMEVRIEGNALVVARASEQAEHCWNEAVSDGITGPGAYDLPGFNLRISIESSEVPAEVAHREAGPDSVWLDPEKVAWPLYVRYWQKGDRFRPIGMEGSRKLQDFFTDRKVPAPARRSVPLLCDDEKICWVLGHRIDDRVKITHSSKSALKVRATTTS